MVQAIVPIRLITAENDENVFIPKLIMVHYWTQMSTLHDIHIHYHSLLYKLTNYMIVSTFLHHCHHAERTFR